MIKMKDEMINLVSKKADLEHKVKHLSTQFDYVKNFYLQETD